VTLLPPGVKVHLAFGYTDMRKGIDGLACWSRASATGSLLGHLFAFRGRKANLIDAQRTAEPARRDKAGSAGPGTRPLAKSCTKGRPSFLR
jgi:hypothetical protein